MAAIFYFWLMRKLLFASVVLVSVVCKPDTQKLDEIVNDWHIAATEANFDEYFGAVTEDFVFLGTAPGERWTKSEFEAFSKPYFDNGKAWSFTPSNRNWVFSENKKIAWFDEDLDTWMRGCRGSGVMVKQKGEWKLAYYNLTVLIENEKMDSFIELRDAPIAE
jgi:hypothetical protein